jgi:alpha-beta hydrolase superfamily lysophospholipase
MEHEPGGTSVCNMSHWAQMIRANNPMQMFYYFVLGNMRRYNQATPPCYPLERISTNLPILIISGTTDTLADPKDIKWLIKKLSRNNVEAIEAKGFNHTDLVWSANCPKQIFPSIMQFVEQYTPSMAAVVLDLSESWHDPATK